jgi:hypothetical protein
MSDLVLVARQALVFSCELYLMSGVTIRAKLVTFHGVRPRPTLMAALTTGSLIGMRLMAFDAIRVSLSCPTNEARLVLLTIQA